MARELLEDLGGGGGEEEDDESEEGGGGGDEEGETGRAPLLVRLRRASFVGARRERRGREERRGRRYILLAAFWVVV